MFYLRANKFKGQHDLLFKSENVFLNNVKMIDHVQKKENWRRISRVDNWDDHDQKVLDDSFKKWPMAKQRVTFYFIIIFF